MRSYFSRWAIGGVDVTAPVVQCAHARVVWNDFPAWSPPSFQVGPDSHAKKCPLENLLKNVFETPLKTSLVKEVLKKVFKEEFFYMRIGPPPQLQSNYSSKSSFHPVSSTINILLLLFHRNHDLERVWRIRTNQDS